MALNHIASRGCFHFRTESAICSWTLVSAEKEQVIGWLGPRAQPIMVRCVVLLFVNLLLSSLWWKSFRRKTLMKKKDKTELQKFAKYKVKERRNRFAEKCCIRKTVVCGNGFSSLSTSANAVMLIHYLPIHIGLRVPTKGSYSPNFYRCFSRAGFSNLSL